MQQQQEQQELYFDHGFDKRRFDEIICDGIDEMPDEEQSVLDFDYQIEKVGFYSDF